MGGYLEDDGILDRHMNNTVSISEQETNILYMRDESFAKVYTSDTTQMTRLDKLCEKNPDMYCCISNTGRGKIYLIADKGLVSFRAKKREMSDEAREAASQRFKDMWANKNTE